MCIHITACAASHADPYVCMHTHTHAYISLLAQLATLITKPDPNPNPNPNPNPKPNPNPSPNPNPAQLATLITVGGVDAVVSALNAPGAPAVLCQAGCG